MRQWIVGFGLGISLFLSALVGGWLVRGHLDAEREATEDSRVAAHAQVAHTIRYIEAATEISVLIEAMIRQGLPPESIERVMREVKGATPYLMDLLVLDGQGEISAWTASGAKPDVRDREYFRVHQQFPDTLLHIDRPTPSRVHHDRWFFSLSRALRDGEGRLTAVIVTIFDIAHLQTRLEAWRARPDMSVRLQHDSGILVARAPARADQRIGTPISPARLPDGPYETATTIGWVEQIGRHPFTVVVERERRAALASWYALATASLLGLLVACGAILMMSTALARRTRLVAEAETLYRALAEQSLAGIVMLRPDGRIIYANPYFASLIGQNPNALKNNRTIGELVDPVDSGRLADQLALWALLDDDQSSLLLSAHDAEGKALALELQGRRVQIAGQPHVLCVVNDVTEQRRIARELEFLAYHDPLTGLPNRAMFFDLMSRTMARYRRSDKPFAVLMVDLDGFKAANDRFGHEAGDLVLQTVAGRMRSAVREVDTVARMGGDEFVVLLEGTSDEADVRRICDKLLTDVAQPIMLGDGLDCSVGCSIGVAICPRDGTDSERLLAKADIAMYRSKSEGKQRMSFASDTPMNLDAAPINRWGPHLELGVPMLDEQHRRLNDLLNQIGLALSAGEPPDALRDRLGELLAYAEHHFAAEEALMERHQLVDQEHLQLTHHRAEHRQLLDELRIVRTHVHEDPQSTLRLLLRNWLVEHIHSSDRHLAAAMHARKAPPAAPAETV